MDYEYEEPDFFGNAPDFSNDMSEDGLEYDDIDLSDDSAEVVHMHYEAMSSDEFLLWQKRAVDQVVEVSGLDREEAFLVLFHTGWNRVGNAISELLENREGLLREVGICVEENENDAEGIVDCLICFESFDVKDMFGMSCGHLYCKSCWTSYLAVALENQALCVKRTTCPFPKCSLVCTDIVWESILEGRNLELYRQFFETAVIDSCLGSCKYCPAPNCGNCILSTPDEVNPVVCQCGYRFCYACHDYEIGDHAPAACEEMSEWVLKAENESGNLNWLWENTQKCPFCRSHIEKNGGCMHMTCTKCYHEFCWLCHGDWNSHNSCNSVKQYSKDMENGIETDLEHYIFYFHRYDSHKEATKIAEKQMNDVSRRIATIKEIFGLRREDITFLETATRQVVNNRHLLTNSYVYAYNLDKKNLFESERNIFEYLQDDLERYTDRLSELLEKIDITPKTEFPQFLNWKEEVTKYSGACHKFYNNFVQGMLKNTLLK